MADIAHEQTDKLINELDKKLNVVYSLANKEMTEKLDDYLKKFEARDKIKQAQLASGKITKKEYQQWRFGQILIGDKWKEMRETLASDMTNTNKIAADIINGHKPTAYALNHNYSTFQLEKDSLVDTSYTLYSHETVENLIKNEPDLLPKNKINVPKDKAWNRKKIDNAVTQGILQGESLKDVSGRLKDVTDMNQNAAVRNARTAMTGAQNVGRIDAYKRAKDLGMSVKKVWLATLDGRTRHSHRTLDGETIDIDEKFSNGLRFPGDADGIGAEVYNCRCTLLGQPKGIDYKVSDLTRRDDKLGGMSYETWQKGQKGFEAMPDSMIANTWSGKKYGHVYNLMKNSDIAGHGADANNFFYALKEIGQETGIGNPPKVWASYLAGDLDDSQIAKFENIIKKYLPELADDVADAADVADTVTDTFEAYKKSLPVKWSELFDQDEELAQELFSNVSKMDAKYWQKYITGEITDSDVDDVLKAHFAKNNGKDFISDKAKDIESKIKWEKAEPMTFKQADDHKVNPLYSKGYESSTTNCQTSTFAYECRRQGYDVVALPRNLDDDIEKLQKELSYDTRKCWITKDKGEKPEFLIKDANGTKDDIYNILEKRIGTNGERYTFEFEWSYTAESSGHIINLDRDENGVLRLVDNQRGKLEKHIWTGEKEIKEYISSGIKNISVTRVDNCIPNPKFFNSIVQKADDIKDSRTWVQLGLSKGDEISDLLDLDMEDAEKFYNQWRCGLKQSKTLDDFMKKDALEVEAKKIVKAESQSKVTGEIQAILEKYGDYKTFATEGEFMDHKKLAAFFKEDGVNANDAIKAAFNELENNKVAKDVAAEVESVFGNKSMSAVYKGIQNIYGNTEGNVFYYKVLQPIGKPSDVWKKYIANELDPLDAANIDDFLLAHIEVIDKIDDVADIAKIKANLPDFGDLDDDIYNKLWETIINKKGDTPFDTYWEKYLADEIKDKELDNILKASKYASNVPDLANKADEIAKASKTLSNINKAKNELDMDVINSKSVSAVWKELNQAKAGGGKFWSDVTEIGKKYGEKPSSLWKKYLANELDADDAAKIETHLAKLYKKADEVDDIKKTLPLSMGSMDDDMFNDIADLLNNKGIDDNTSYYKKWLKGKIKDTDLDDYFKVPTTAPKSATSEAINVLDEVKNKKVSTIWNELKAEEGSAYSQWWKTVSDIGKPYSKKPSEVWDMYLNSQLKDDEKEKIENFLLKNYLKKADDKTDDLLKLKASLPKDSFIDAVNTFDDDVAEKIWNYVGDNLAVKHKMSTKEVWQKYIAGEIKDKDLDDILKSTIKKAGDVIDYSEFGGKEVYDTLKKYGSVDDFLFDAPAAEYDKIVKLFHDNADEVQAAIDKIKKLEKTKAGEAIEKSEELIKAEAKLKKAQDKLKKADTGEVFTGIWKEDVTLADYENKKKAINAKKIYFEDEIDKLKNNPDYQSWLSAEDKEQKIIEFQHKLGLLDEFEVDGKKYAKLQKEVTKAQQEVQKYAPSAFSNSYSQERKDAALWPKSRQEADSLFMAHSQAEWDAAKPAERKAIKEYTQSYHKFNEPLRGIQYGTSQYKGVGKTDLNAGYANNGKALNAMTDYLDKCSSEHDQWLQRGCDWGGMDKFLQIDMNKLRYGTEKELQDALLGKTITEYGFMSAGTAKGKGFSGSILFNIFTPKGTKMSYAELYSHFKGGSEVETIIQQGSQFIITKVERTNGQIYIDIELVNQLPPQRWTS